MCVYERERERERERESREKETRRKECKGLREGWGMLEKKRKKMGKTRGSLRVNTARLGRG